MARRYLDVESLDGAVVRCEVLEWYASRYAQCALGGIDSARHSLVLRPDTGGIVLVFHRVRGRVAMISMYDPNEFRHEWDWPILAERLERHTNRSK